MTVDLPPGFILGAATSAFQIEGAADLRGETIWDRFIAERGLADDGRVACDHVRRVEGDLDLMAELGLDAYRFSVSWARIMPDGRGHIDPRGLGFYDRLVDGLLERGITPWLTLFHWDLPQAIEDRGGWRSRDTIGAFTDLTELLARSLGDRVEHWITQNEPWVFAMLGHREGVFAPGSTDAAASLTVAHHLLVSHGAAAQAIRAADSSARIAIALDCRPAQPASDREDDVEATHRFDGLRHRWYLDPLFGRGYPADIVAHHQRRGHFSMDDDGPVREGDMDLIGQPLDVLGINFYTGTSLRAGEEETDPTPVAPSTDPPAGHTEMGWAVQPEALHDFLVRVHRDYSPAEIVITECGASYSDAPGPDGHVRDVRRIDYLHDHLHTVLRARAGGVPVTGFLIWSLLDNLEWASGFAQRFGLIWVDRTTQDRVIKDSGRWLQATLADRRIAEAPGPGRGRPDR